MQYLSVHKNGSLGMTWIIIFALQIRTEGYFSNIVQPVKGKASKQIQVSQFHVFSPLNHTTFWEFHRGTLSSPTPSLYDG